MRDVRPICVEIHWRLINDPYCFNLDEQVLWRERCSANLAGEPIPCFPLAELLIYLCAHGTKHCWQRLSWVCDIAELIRLELAIDWDALSCRQRRAIGAASRMVSLSASFWRSICWGAAVPDSVTRVIQADETAGDLAGEVFERYDRETNSPPGVPKFWRFNVRARERLRDRLTCRLKVSVRAFMANERDFAFLRLPPRLFFLYYAVKPARLACEYAWNPSRFFRLIGDLMGTCRQIGGTPRDDWCSRTGPT